MSFLLNEAFDFFCGCFDENTLSEAGIRKYIEGFAACTPCTLLFNINAQKAIFDSKVWDPIWKDLEKQPDGSFQYRGKKVSPSFVIRTKEMFDAVPDPFGIAVKACREIGIRPFFSMRMNDVHHVEDPDSVQVSDFWREHQDCLTAPYTSAWFWWGHTFDYACPEVYRHHLDLVRESFERFDIDGLELDWMRSPYYLKPGREIEDAHVLTQFMRDSRKLADQAEKKYGHPIDLIVRMPPRPEDARKMGFDVPAWAAEKLITRVILTSYFGSTDYDYPLELWRALLGNEIKLTASLEILSRGKPEDAVFPVTPEISFGHAASFYYRGSDDIYLFNFFDTKNSSHFFGSENEAADTLTRIHRTVGSREKVEARKRRHIVSFTDTFSRALGYLPDPVLPRKANQWPPAFLRLNVGGAVKGRAARTVIAWDGDEPEKVLCNGVPCTKSAEPFTDGLPQNIKNPTVYRIPDGVLKDGDNMLYFEGNCAVTWCEIDIESRS